MHTTTAAGEEPLLQAAMEEEDVVKEEYVLSKVPDFHRSLSLSKNGSEFEQKASNLRGTLDVHFSNGNMKADFTSSRDEEGKQFEKAYRRINQRIVQQRFDEYSQDDAYVEDVNQGHRVIFDTDGHYRRLYDVCMNVVLHIFDLSFTWNWVYTLHSDPKYGDDSDRILLLNPKAWYFVLAVVGILFWQHRSLDMCRAVIGNDLAYHKNFYSNPNDWRCFGILCTFLLSEVPTFLCPCCKFAKDPLQEKEWRAFTLWRSVFAMCAFGIPRDVMDIISILHPEKALARAWPCHLEVTEQVENERVNAQQPTAEAQTRVRTVHRIWQYWFPGEKWEYDFENKAVSRNARFLTATKIGKLILTGAIMRKPEARSFSGIGALVFHVMTLIQKVNSMSVVNKKADDFKAAVKKDLTDADPAKRLRAKRNLKVYWP